MGKPNPGAPKGGYGEGVDILSDSGFFVESSGLSSVFKRDGTSFGFSDVGSVLSVVLDAGVVDEDEGVVSEVEVGVVEDVASVVVDSVDGVVDDDEGVVDDDVVDDEGSVDVESVVEEDVVVA